MSNENQELLEIWTWLPDDILLHIFQFLPAASLLKVAQVYTDSVVIFF